MPTLGIEREALLQRCANSTDGGVVLFEAPAGFGKSYALAQWCERALNARRTVSWIRLQPTERSSIALARKLIEALRQSGVKQLPMQAVGKIDSDPFGFVAALTRSLADHGRDLLLAMDDYQVIEGGPADALLGQLFEHLPSNAWVALASRRTCPISLSRLLLEGRLHRIGPRSLQFSRAEAREFFGRSLGAWPQSQLYALTEGWPAALKMAQLCLPEWKANSSDIRALPEFSRLIDEYCRNEVLREVDQETVDLLISCSIVETLEPRVCDAIRDRHDSCQILAQLARRETFLEPLGGDIVGWRLPKLLRQALIVRAAERAADKASAVHMRAGEHFEAVGDVRAALHHYVQANNPAMAAAALERAALLFLIITQGDLHGEALLDLIPEAQLQRFPRLALCRVFLDFKRGLHDEARTLLEVLAQRTHQFTQDRPGGDPAQLKAESLCLEMLIDLYRSSRASLADLGRLEQRLTTVTKSDPRLVSFFRITLGMLYKLRGDLEMAASHFNQCHRLNVAHRTGWYTLWLTYHFGSLALARGQLMEARYQLQAGLKIWHRDFRAHPTFRTIARLALAEIDYETDSLHEAQIKLGEALYMAEDLEGSYESYAGLYEIAAMIHLHAGHHDRVESLLARGAASPRVVAMLERFLPALRVRLDLLQQQLDSAQRSIERHSFDRLWWASDFQDELTYREWDLIGVCLCHLAFLQGNFARARQVAARLEQVARVSGRGRTLVKALILRATIVSHEGDEAEAIRVLVDALELAQPAGYRRVILDDADLVRPVLRAVAERAEPAIPAHLSTYARSLYQTLVPKARSIPAERTSVTFSEREQDVLRELSLGHSNKIIARKLGLSAPTIKFHINNIFRKLGVRKRAAAVAEAHRRGCLS
jgi:LuxR family maltose regulon positive regulatory protein